MHFEDYVNLTFSHLQIKNVRFDVESEKKYLLRVINANVFNCPVLFSVAEHELNVRRNDGHLVDAGDGAKASRIIVFPGMCLFYVTCVPDLL